MRTASLVFAAAAICCTLASVFQELAEPSLTAAEMVYQILRWSHWVAMSSAMSLMCRRLEHYFP